MKDWKIYCNLLKSGQLCLDDECRARANRARARYRLAKNYEAIEAKNISQQTLRGYSAVFSVFLTYTAAEQIGNFTKQPINNWIIQNEKLAKLIRPIFKQVGADTREHFNRTTLIKELNSFINEGNANLRIPATALRVMFAHGTFTPTTTKLLSQKRADVIFSLSHELLQEADKQFSNWLDSLRDHAADGINPAIQLSPTYT